MLRQKQLFERETRRFVKLKDRTERFLKGREWDAWRFQTWIFGPHVTLPNMGSVWFYVVALCVIVTTCIHVIISFLLEKVDS